MARIIVIDDEDGILNVLGGVLGGDGHEVHTIKGDDSLLEALSGEQCDILLTDLKMGAVSGMDVLKYMHEKQPEVPVVILTGYATMEVAQEAMQYGVFDVITKPFKIDQLSEVINNALAYKRDNSSGNDLRAVLGAAYRLDRTVCESDEMHRVCDMVERTAPLDMPVLIQGPKGTDRKGIAEELHKAGSRRSAGLHVVSCGDGSAMRLEADLFGYMKDAFPGADADTPGILESIDGGTLVIDEIDLLSEESQARILALIADKTYTSIGGREATNVNVRVVATSAVNLQQLAASGAFNKDLVNRLSILTIEIKPLAGRSGDKLYLAYDILTRAALAGKPFKTLAASAAKAISCYNWPGNEGEMEEVLLSALDAASEDVIDLADLPSTVAIAAGDGTGDDALESLRGQYLRKFISSQS